MDRSIHSTKEELDDFLGQMVRNGHAVFDPVIEKYRLTELGQEWADTYVHGKPPSKKVIRETFEQMVRMGHATFDPATERYTPTELGLRLMDEFPDSEYQDILWSRPPPSKKL